ncbi:MAG: HEPN domain-containing protein [Verrucomicrobiia bacterium]
MKTNRSTKVAADEFDPLDESETEYCDNYLCESEAIKTVPVSVEKAGDSERKFCAACYEAYVIGVQHGRISDLELFLESNGRKDAIDSVMNNRHQIAHGKNSGITIARVRGYLDKAEEVLNFIERQTTL